MSIIFSYSQKMAKITPNVYRGPERVWEMGHVRRMSTFLEKWDNNSLFQAKSFRIVDVFISVKKGGEKWRNDEGWRRN